MSSIKQSGSSSSQALNVISACLLAGAAIYVLYYEGIHSRTREAKGFSVVKDVLFHNAYTKDDIRAAPAAAAESTNQDFNLIPENLGDWIHKFIAVSDPAKPQVSPTNSRIRAPLKQTSQNNMKGNEARSKVVKAEEKQARPPSPVVKKEWQNPFLDQEFAANEQQENALASYMMSWLDSALVNGGKKVSKEDKPKQTAPQSKPADAAASADEDLARVLAALFKSAKKGSVSSAKLLQKLVSVDEQATKDESNTKSKDQIMTSPPVQVTTTPLESAIKSGAGWRVFHEQIATESELERVSPLLLSLQARKDALASAVLSAFVGALADPAPVAQNDNGRVFVNFFNQKDTDTSVDGFMAYVRDQSRKGINSATSFLANVLANADERSDPPAENPNIFLDNANIWNRQTAESPGSQSFVDFLLGAAKLGSSSAADVLSQLVESKTEVNTAQKESKPANSNQFFDALFVSQNDEQDANTGNKSGSKNPAKKDQPDAKNNDNSNAMDAIKRKWEALIEENSPKNHLATYFIRQQSDTLAETADNTPAAFLSSLQAAAEKGASSAKELFSKLLMIDEATSTPNEPRLADILPRIAKKPESVWVKQESSLPLIESLQSRGMKGDSFAVAVLKKLVDSLVANEAASSATDGKVFSDFFESEKAAALDKSEDSLGQFLTFVKESIDAGSKSAAAFANSFSSDASLLKTKAATFGGIWTDSNPKQSQVSSPSAEFWKFLTAHSLKGNPSASNILADIFVAYSQMNQKASFPTRGHEHLELMDELAQFSIANPDKSMLQAISSKLRRFKEKLVENTSTGTVRNPRQTAASPSQQQSSGKTASGSKKLKDFFVSQDWSQSDVPESVQILDSMKDAARAGSAAAKSLLSRILILDHTLDSAGDPLAPLLKATSPPTKDNTQTNSDPVIPLIKSLQSAASSGSILASSIADTFFKTLVSSGPSEKMDAADQIFLGYFKSSGDTAAPGEKEPLADFVNYVNSLIAEGSSTAKLFAAGISEGLSNQTPKSFNQAFTEAFETEAPVYETSPAQEFLGYLAKATSSGSTTAADMYARFFVGGPPVFLNSAAKEGEEGLEKLGFIGELFAPKASESYVRGKLRQLKEDYLSVQQPATTVPTAESFKSGDKAQKSRTNTVFAVQDFPTGKRSQPVQPKARAFSDSTFSDNAFPAGSSFEDANLFDHITNIFTRASNLAKRYFVFSDNSKSKSSKRDSESVFQRQQNIDCSEERFLNGGFQDGKLTHWMTAKEAASEGDVLVSNSGSVLKFSRRQLSSLSDSSGDQLNEPVAVFDNDGAGSYVLHRKFTPRDGDSITFKWKVNNYASEFNIREIMSAQVLPNQQFRVDIFEASFSDWFGTRENEDGHLATILSPQAVQSKARSGWNQVSFDLSKFQGRPIRIAFRAVNNQELLNIGIKDVIVSNKYC
ncbi:hypothetical protein HDU78_005209 [Chytriomyces hyalinus]|nr:hypothetical protein HDU78_005209 [Chytriomyces hyalinus]